MSSLDFPPLLPLRIKLSNRDMYGSKNLTEALQQWSTYKVQGPSMVVHDSSKGWYSMIFSIEQISIKRLSETPDIQEERLRLQMYSTIGVVGDQGQSAGDRQ